MEKQKLESLLESTATNFKFKLDESFEPFVDLIFERIKHSPTEDIIKRFHQLWLKPNQEWNDEFGWGGYPSVARWLEVLDKKPLTEIEIARKKREYQANLLHKAEVITRWVNDPNLRTFFPSRYKNPEYSYIKNILDKFWGIKEELTDDRIVKMAICTKKRFLDDPVGFRKEFMGVAREQSPLLLT